MKFSNCINTTGILTNIPTIDFSLFQYLNHSCWPWLVSSASSLYDFFNMPSELFHFLEHSEIYLENVKMSPVCSSSISFKLFWPSHPWSRCSNYRPRFRFVPSCCSISVLHSTPLTIFLLRKYYKIGPASRVLFCTGSNYIPPIKHKHYRSLFSILVASCAQEMLITYIYIYIYIYLWWITNYYSGLVPKSLRIGSESLGICSE